MTSAEFPLRKCFSLALDTFGYFLKYNNIPTKNFSLFQKEFDKLLSYSKLDLPIHKENSSAISRSIYLNNT